MIEYVHLKSVFIAAWGLRDYLAHHETWVQKNVVTWTNLLVNE